MISNQIKSSIATNAQLLGVPADWLDNVIWLESNYSTTVQNSIGATGLIQFTKTTAKSLGTTTDALKAMPFEKQMDFVNKYLTIQIKRFGRPKEFIDLYAMVFYPPFVNAPDTTMLPQSAYKGNAPLDLNKNGQISKAEFVQFINNRLKKKSILNASNQALKVLNTAKESLTKASNRFLEIVKSNKDENVPIKIVLLVAGVIVVIFGIAKLFKRRN